MLGAPQTQTSPERKFQNVIRIAIFIMAVLVCYDVIWLVIGPSLQYAHIINIELTCGSCLSCELTSDITKWLTAETDDTIINKILKIFILIIALVFYQASMFPSSVTIQN